MHYIYSLYHFFPYVIAWGKRIKWEKCKEDSLVEIVKHGDAKKWGGRGKGHYRNTYFGFFFTKIAILVLSTKVSELGGGGVKLYYMGFCP